MMISIVQQSLSNVGASSCCQGSRSWIITLQLSGLGPMSQRTFCNIVAYERVQKSIGTIIVLCF